MPLSLGSSREVTYFEVLFMLHALMRFIKKSIAPFECAFSICYYGAQYILSWDLAFKSLYNRCTVPLNNDLDGGFLPEDVGVQ